MDVVAVAGEHEFLLLDLDGADVGAACEELDACAEEEVFRFLGEPAKAVSPLFFELIDVLDFVDVG